MRKIYRTIRPISVLALLLVLFSACGKLGSKLSYSKPFENTSSASFRDIPGVTEDEIKAIEVLQKQFDHFRYGMIPSTESFYNSNGEIRGFSALFCEWLTGLFGIPFIPENHEFIDLLEKLAHNEVDFTGALTATEERQKTFFMTSAIGLNTIQYFRIAGSIPLEILAESRPLRYVFMEGTTTIDLVTSKLIPGAYEIIRSTDIDEVYRMLKSGEVDAHLNVSKENAFDVYGDVVSSDFFPLIFTISSLMAQNPALKPIISVVQKALDNGALTFLAELHNAGEQEYLRNKLFMQFNEEERLFLQNNPVIPFVTSTTNYPVTFFNEREKQWQGIAFDVLKDVGALTGLSFERVNNVDIRLPVMLDMMRNGEASMITELMYSAERAENFIWTKAVYMVDYSTLISRSDYRNISLNEIINVKVGLIRGHAHTSMFREWFPGHSNTIEYDQIRAAFDALDSGEVEMIMASTHDILLLTNYLERTGFKTNYIFNNPVSFTFAFNKDEALLCSIVDKALRLINTNRITDQWISRIYDYRIKVVQARMPWLIGSFVLLLSALAIVAVLFARNRRAGKQLALQSQAVFAASRAKGIFLATMSHEIRTPLNAIIGMAYIVKDCVADNEKALHGVNQIMTSSHHLLGILNDILDMSKIESGKLELTHEPFSLLAACTEVADIMIHRCVEKNITFVANIHEIKDITLIGDKLRLNQVLINLLGNAVKFTNANGEIKFITEILEESEEKARVKFSVTDNGIGMSEAQMKKLFIPFEQTDSTIAARFGGTGLGLSLSQNFVRMMGGEIRVASKLDEGSVFDFLLSFDKGRFADGEAAGEEFENVNLSGKRMLLAEDIEINRLIVCELLSLSGLSIDEVENGRQAVEAFDGSPEGYYDIILMDIQMPELNGYEATREIRALDRADAKTTPIIAMTAHAYKEDVEQALAAGMNGHLAKPIDKFALMETVGRILKD